MKNQYTVVAATLWTTIAVAAIQSPLTIDHDSSQLVRDLIGFHKNLTEIESISYNESAAGDWLADSLSNQGYNVEKQCLEHQPSRCNILAWPGHVRQTRLLLTSHYDTVPPFYPYKIETLDNETTISGRGSVDAKASIAAQTIAVNNLLSSHQISRDDVALLFVVGEEKGGEGMRAANLLRLRPQAVIFGEPTECRLVSGHKGSLPIRLSTKGHAVHSGYPWLGRSAIDVLVQSLSAIKELEQSDRLPQSEKYGRTTFNIGQVEGGVAGNVVAANATARIDIRIARGTPAFVFHQLTRQVHAAVQPFLEKGMRPKDVVEIEMLNSGYAPIDLDVDVPGFEFTTVNYGTDIPNWRMWDPKQKRYLYGPGSIFVAHSDHEALTEVELRKAVEGYERLIVNVLRQ